MNMGSNLHISTDVIAKIARCAALEIDGVADVACGTQGKVKELLEIVSLQTPVTVEMHDGIAAITVDLIVDFGTRIPAIAEKVQENIKDKIQTMTGNAVTQVNVNVADIEITEEEQ